MSFLVVVTGSRHWHYAVPIIEELRHFPDGTILMHGGANGADDMAGAVAKVMCPNIAEIIVVPADWKKFPRAAGPIRNQKMIEAHPDFVLAFTNDLEKSKGTRDCVNRARRAGIPVKVIGFPGGHDIASRRWSDADEDTQLTRAGRKYGGEDYGGEYAKVMNREIDD